MSEFFQDSPHSAIPPKEFNEMKLKKKKRSSSKDFEGNLNIADRLQSHWEFGL